MYCWPSPSNQSYCRQIAGCQRGSYMGDHIGQQDHGPTKYTTPKIWFPICPAYQNMTFFHISCTYQAEDIGRNFNETCRNIALSYRFPTYYTKSKFHLVIAVHCKKWIIILTIISGYLSFIPHFIISMRKLHSEYSRFQIINNLMRSFWNIS